MADQIVEPIYGTLPFVKVRLRLPDQHIPRAYLAFVDSGANWTLANVAIARALGISDDDLRGGRSALFRGVGNGPNTEARGVQLHLSIGTDRARAIELEGAWVYFTTAGLPGGVDLLLGQIDALQRLTFAQVNHAPQPKFVLRFPPTR